MVLENISPQKTGERQYNKVLNGAIMLDKIKNTLHTAMPYLSYVINTMNRILSVISSFLGIELPEITTAGSEETSEETTAA